MSALAYPQLGTGALIQYPVKKTRRARSVVNEAADGSTVRLSDQAGQTIEWLLRYEGLSDVEADALEEFFRAAEGSLQGFLFSDPVANLLSWSDRLDRPSWQADPLLTTKGEAEDPAGGTRAWLLSNGGGAGQRIGQTLQAAGGHTYCLSVYVRAARAATLTLWIGNEAMEGIATENWSRVVFSAVAPIEADSLRFAVEIPAGAEIEVYGIQVEPQAGAGVYRASARGGVYADAHFGDDVFRLTRTDVNRNSCTVKIIHANHL